MPNVIRFQSSYIEPYPLEVQGESNYQKNIEDICGFVDDEEGVDADDFIAQLFLEDDNQYDPGNAVRVDIDGKTVGYLSKPTAKKYRVRLVALGLSDVIGECYASIKGGFFKRSTGEQADFGVRLDLNLDDFEVLKPKAEISAPPAPAPEPEPVHEEVKQIPVPAPNTPSAADVKTRRMLIFIAVSFVGCFILATIYLTPQNLCAKLST